MWTPPDNNIYNLPVPGTPIFGKAFKINPPAPPCLVRLYVLENRTLDLLSHLNDLTF